MPARTDGSISRPNRRVRSTWLALTTSATAALGALLLTALPTLAQLAGHPSLVNVSNAGLPADADSSSVAVSADGTMVAFASDGANLVPLDNNGDTDVFFHDTVTGITTRVSVNWQGKEAQGDSTCPSMSADGRYVAFRSRAWNMVQGGGNVGHLPWEVYLHDRQGPETIRVSAPPGGGPPTSERFRADSGCPVISADGRRVVFWSHADNLVPGDTNIASDIFVYDVPGDFFIRASVAEDGSQADQTSEEPVLSGDGTVVAFSSFASNLSPLPRPSYDPRQVYVRDLSAGTTEMISRGLLGPSDAPNGASRRPQISSDGTLVIFHSTAGNLISNLPLRQPERLFLHDRSDGTTETVEPISVGPGPCGWLSDPLICDRSRTKGAALSPDGRFVAFLSASTSLLPESRVDVRQDQIYIKDRDTGRLRRVTVDPTGYPLSNYPCGGSSSTLALSGDGQVLLFVGENVAPIGLPEANVGDTRDIVRLDWACDPQGNACRELSRCPETPTATCASADRSRLWIRRNPPLGARRDRFTWRWVSARNGDSPAFVDPAEGSYHLCVYGGEPMTTQLDAGIPAGDDWRSTQKGWLLRDRSGAVDIVRFREGRSRSAVKIVSSSPALDIPYLPLVVPQGLTVQLHESTTGSCWESAFPADAVRVNRRGAVTGGDVVPGAVLAVIR